MNLKNAKLIADTLGIDLLSLPLRHRTFRIQWQTEETMFAFYETFLNQEELNTYRFLTRFATKQTVFTRKEACPVLTSSFALVSYAESTHPDIMTFMENYAPASIFNQYRLVEVTGSLLIDDEYPMSFPYVVQKTMENVAKQLIDKIQDQVNTTLKREFFKRLERKEKIIDKQICVS